MKNAVSEAAGHEFSKAFKNTFGGRRSTSTVKITVTGDTKRFGFVFN